MDKSTLKEAYETINEWGIDEDDFVAEKFCRFIANDKPDDNSIELSRFHRTQLQIIVDLGLQEAKLRLFTDGG